MAKNLGKLFTVGTKLTNDVSDFKNGNKEAAESTKKVKKSLNDLEKEQSELNKKLKGIAVGTKEYNKMARELAGVNTRIKDAELKFEGLDMEGRASEMKSVVGGFGDMATGIAAVSSSLSGHDLEKFVKTVETVEKTTIGITGAMEAWASGQKLVNSWLALATTKTNTNTVATKANEKAKKDNSKAKKDNSKETSKSTNETNKNTLATDINSEAKDKNAKKTSKLSNAMKSVNKVLSKAYVKITLIIAGLVAFGTGIQTLLQYFPEIGKTFDRMAKKVSDAMEWMHDTAVETINAIIREYNELANMPALKKLGLPNVNEIKSTWAGVTKYISGKWDSVANHDFTKMWLKNLKSFGGNVSSLVDQLIKELDKAAGKLDKKTKTPKTPSAAKLTVDQQIFGSIDDEEQRISRNVQYGELNEKKAGEMFNEFLNKALQEAIDKGATKETIDEIKRRGGRILADEDSSNSSSQTSGLNSVDEIATVSTSLASSFRDLSDAMNQTDLSVLDQISLWGNMASRLGASVSTISSSLEKLGQSVSKLASNAGAWGAIIGAIVEIGTLIASSFMDEKEKISNVARTFSASEVDNSRYFNRSGEFLNGDPQNSNVPVVEMVVRGADLYRVLKRDDLRRGI